MCRAVVPYESPTQENIYVGLGSIGTNLMTIHVKLENSQKQSQDNDGAPNRGFQLAPLIRQNL
jgi:hypothetical protein